MSNNKQSSVDWLAEIIRFANKELYAEMFDEIEQARAMHEEEITQAWKKGDAQYDNVAEKMSLEYYNEVYGGNK